MSSLETMLPGRPPTFLTPCLENRRFDFGAFVDIGVKQDGLIHRSKLRNRHLAVGQVIEVEVLEVDEKRGRISLALG